MNFILSIIPFIAASGYKASTSRGNALHTVDWYMHGKQTINNYDDKNIQVKSLSGM